MNEKGKTRIKLWLVLGLLIVLAFLMWLGRAKATTFFIGEFIPPSEVQYLGIAECYVKEEVSIPIQWIPTEPNSSVGLIAAPLGVGYNVDTNTVYWNTPLSVGLYEIFLKAVGPDEQESIACLVLNVKTRYSKPQFVPIWEYTQ